MVSIKYKKKTHNVLSAGQNRLLKEALKQLLGPGLIQSTAQRTEREEKAYFLKDALNSKILDEEWLT